MCFTKLNKDPLQSAEAIRMNDLLPWIGKVDILIASIIHHQLFVRSLLCPGN